VIFSKGIFKPLSWYKYRGLENKIRELFYRHYELEIKTQTYLDFGSFHSRPDFDFPLGIFRITSAPDGRLSLGGSIFFTRTLCAMRIFLFSSLNFFPVKI
jgi:hypothetical protein